MFLGSFNSENKHANKSKNKTINILLPSKLLENFFFYKKLFYHPMIQSSSGKKGMLSLVDTCFDDDWYFSSCQKLLKSVWARGLKLVQGNLLTFQVSLILLHNFLGWIFCVSIFKTLFNNTLDDNAKKMIIRLDTIGNCS